MCKIDFDAIEGIQDSYTRVFQAVKCLILEIRQKIKRGPYLFLVVYLS